MDIYPLSATVDEDLDRLFPVVVFIHGGSWMTGDKSLYAPMAESFRHNDYILVVPNFSKLPESNLNAMIQELTTSINWTQNNIGAFGGDPSQVYLMGHSTGAHLVTMTVLANAFSEMRKDSISFSSTMSKLVKPFPIFETQFSPLKGIITFVYDNSSVSGVFDLEQQFLFEKERGIDEISAIPLISKDFNASASPLDLIKAFANDRQSIQTGSPSSSASLQGLQNKVRRMSLNAFRIWIPQTWLVLHGSKDSNVSQLQSISFHDCLKHRLDIQNAQIYLNEKFNHVDPIISLYDPNDGYTRWFFEQLKQKSS